MAQKGLMKILSRKNGKGMISENEGNEKIKVTKVLEFVPARRPEDAKLGEVIRFMYNPGNGLSAYWLQGTISGRVDKYNVSKECNFRKNRVKVNKLSIINCWGEEAPLPESLTVNLSKNTAWCLGEEVELQTTGDDEAITFEPGETCDTNEDDDETTGNTSVKNDETEASCRTKIAPCPTESDSDSLAKIKLANINHEEDASTIISTISDYVSEIRRLRTLHINNQF